MDEEELHTYLVTVEPTTDRKVIEVEASNEEIAKEEAVDIMEQNEYFFVTKVERK